MSLRRRTISLLNVKEHPMCVPLETIHLLRNNIFRYFRLPFPPPPHFSPVFTTENKQKMPFSGHNLPSPYE